MSLVFTADQLRQILTEFISVFENPLFKVQLSAVAPDEQKMEQVIETHQREVFQHHGIDPNRGFADLGRANQVFVADQPLIKLLGICAAKEDMAYREALGQPIPGVSSPQAPTVQTVPNLGITGPSPAALQPGVDPRMFEQMKHFAKENPQQFQQQVQLARQLATNPAMVMQLRDQLVQRIAQNPALQPQLDQLNTLIATMPAQTAAATAAATRPMMKPPGSEDMENDMQ